MKQYFFLLGLFCLALISCQQKEGLNYNNQFVKMESELLPYIDSTEIAVEHYLKNDQMDSVAFVGEKMEKLIQDRINRLTNDPVPNATGADAFKKAGIQYFNYLKSVYTAYKDFGNAKDQQTKDAVEARFKYVTQFKEQAISNIKTAQEKFGAANGFKIGSLK